VTAPPANICPPSAGAPERPELEFLARETGGKIYRFYGGDALVSMARDLASQKSGDYVLSYTSARDTDFGRAYIPVEVEVNLIRGSGRDEAGYYAPLQY
jgi:hypothetical protein